jgi:hypothetical protein
MAKKLPSQKKTVARESPTSVKRAEVPPLPDAPDRTRKPAVRSGGIKVEATKMGYYDHIRRRPGDVFRIAKEEDFSDNWMRRVDERTPERVTTSQQALKAQQEEIKSLKDRGELAAKTDDAEDLATGGDNPLGD